MSFDTQVKNYTHVQTTACRIAPSFFSVALRSTRDLEKPALTVTTDDQGHVVVSSVEPPFDALVVPADRVLRINPRDCSDLNQNVVGAILRALAVA